MDDDSPPLSLDIPEDTSIQHLEDYALVPYIDEFAGDITLPAIRIGTSKLPVAECLTQSPDEAWLVHVHKVLIEHGEQLQEKPLTYAGFFSHGQNAEDIRPRATVGIFPIFYKKVSSMAMQKHSMLMIKKAEKFVNPGQLPVIVGDCPLYAQQKKCQWNYVVEVGESKMVCYGLPSRWDGIPRMLWEAIGRIWLGPSISPSKDFHFRRCSFSCRWRAHQAHSVRIPGHPCLVHVLKIQAYNEYYWEGYGPHKSMDMWENRLIHDAPTVSNWITVRNYLLINCRFVRGHRLGDWPLTLSACEELCPWFSTFVYTNYARWMPIFLKDMASLQDIHRSVHEWKENLLCNVATRIFPCGTWSETWA